MPIDAAGGQAPYQTISGGRGSEMEYERAWIMAMDIIRSRLFRKPPTYHCYIT